MKVIVGLGNPGKRYQHTPHNVGFDAVERLSDRLGCSLKRRIRFKARTGKTRDAGEDLLLVLPQTYMNDSGSAVSTMLSFYKADASDLIVIVDDADLDPGTIRVKGKGGSGGHRGLQSIIDCIGTAEFARVRIGVGRGRAGEDLVNRVLAKMSSAERKVMDESITRAAEAAMAVVASGVDAAMNEFNGTSADQ